MHKKLLLVFLLSTLIVVALTHYFAIEFSLYFKYLWLDIPMHFLGGICVAFAILLLPYSSLAVPERLCGLTPVLFGVLVIGLIWELYEIKIGIPLLVDNFETDMLKDLFVDLLGGAAGYCIGKMTKIEENYGND